MDKTIPNCRPSIFKLGNLLDLYQKGPLVALSEFSRLSKGSCFVLWCGFIPHVILQEPELIKQVLLNSGENFERNADNLETLFRKGLLSSRGERWKKHRRMLTPPFQMKPISEMLPLLVANMQNLFNELNGQETNTFRPNRPFSDLMLTNLTSTVFGIDFSLEPNECKKMQSSLITLTQELVKRHFSPFPYWKLIHSSKIKESEKFLLEVVDKIIAQGEKKFNPKVKKQTLLNLLLEQEQLGKITHSDIQDEILGLLIAGHVTSATALSWIVAMLAKHPEIQQKARNEVDILLNEKPPQLENIHKLEYVNQVIFETLRLYPIIPLSIYKATKDVLLGEHKISKGTRIDIFSYLIHRDPKLWKNPLQFCPERFSNEKLKDISPYHYFPFLIGPHLCLGKNLALLELKVAVAMLLQRFEIGTDVGNLSENLRVSLHPKGLEIQLKSRIKF